jgi:hypothetical protein
VDTTDPANGGQTVSGRNSPLTVQGLTNGDSYTFTVTAINGVGPSVASSPTTAVVPATVPGAPTIGSATAGTGQATVTFTRPASDGGSALLDYTVKAIDVTNRANGGQTATGTSSPLTVTGLTAGDQYYFRVEATNVMGSGTESAVTSRVTPS